VLQCVVGVLQCVAVCVGALRRVAGVLLVCCKCVEDVLQ